MNISRNSNTHTNKYTNININTLRRCEMLINFDYCKNKIILISTIVCSTRYTVYYTVNMNFSSPSL